ncbi:hypothetical protein [Burkholderia cenocepacia]|uniref:hypothetical protein n=1 Tax=Burkholderia cenocepacia TaxID=95486 RepID=UPI002012B352|nr:hypothetical protein [Burkholderia cenocepacia]
MKGADNGQPCAACIYVPRSGRRDGEPVTLVAEQEGADLVLVADGQGRVRAFGSW